MQQPEEEKAASSKADADLAAALARTLRCPVCLDLLKDPLVAPCGHAACASCARAAIEANPACPTCRAPTDATSLVPCAALQQVRDSSRERGGFWSSRRASEVEQRLGHCTRTRKRQEAGERGERDGVKELASRAFRLRRPDATVASSHPPRRSLPKSHPPPPKNKSPQKQAASRVQCAAKAGPGGRSAAARLRDLLDEQEAASRAGGGAAGGRSASRGPGGSSVVDAAELDAALARLAACRAAAASAAADADLRLLLQFLRHARARKQSRLEQLRGELDAVEADLALVSACGGSGGGKAAAGGGGGGSSAAAAADAAADAAAANANLVSAAATVPSLEDGTGTRGGSYPGSDFETAPAVPAIEGAREGSGGGSGRQLLTGSGTGGGGGGAATTATATTTTTTSTFEEGGSGAGGGGGGSGGRGTRRSARAAAAAASNAASNAASVEQQQQQKQQAIVIRGKDKEAAATAPPAQAAEASDVDITTALALFDPSAAHRARKRRVAAQFDSLQECYLSLRREREGEAEAADPPSSSVDAVAAASAVAEMATNPCGASPSGAAAAAAAAAAASAPPRGGGGGGGGLAEFSRLLSTFVRCSELEVLARLPATGGGAGGRTALAPPPSSSRRGGGDASTPALLPPPPPPSSSSTPRSIVSSLDFDASGRWLAAAAVAKRVSVFDFEEVLRAGRAERRWNERRQHADDGAGAEEGGRCRRRRRRAVRGAGRDGSDAPAPPRPVFELLTRSKLSCAVWAKTRSDPAAAARRSDNEDEEASETDDDDEDDDGGETLPRRPPPPLLVSTDYCGSATVWDPATGRPLLEVDAHDRRAWSADWSPSAGGCQVFATASDDGTAKVWALNASRGSSGPAAAAAGAPPSASSTSAPAITLDVRANVCSAAFDASDPSGNVLALGAADHAVRVYDLRSPGAPLHVLSGHKKAASYVRWGAGGLVSASTDSTLRLWPLPKSGGAAAAAAGAAPAAASPLPSLRPPRVFRGHVNERNFVGLAADPRHDLLAAGSETGEVVVWHASMARPVAKARVSSSLSLGGGGGGGSGGDSVAPTAAAAAPPPFVSAVAWRPLPDHAYPSKNASLHDVESATYTLVAANAHGALQVMRLGGGGGGGSKAKAAAAKAAAAKRRRVEQGLEGEDDDGLGDGEDDV